MLDRLWKERVASEIDMIWKDHDPKGFSVPCQFEWSPSQLKTSPSATEKHICPFAISGSLFSGETVRVHKLFCDSNCTIAAVREIPPCVVTLQQPAQAKLQQLLSCFVNSFVHKRCK